MLEVSPNFEIPGHVWGLVVLMSFNGIVFVFIVKIICFKNFRIYDFHFVVNPHSYKYDVYNGKPNFFSSYITYY